MRGDRRTQSSHRRQRSRTCKRNRLTNSGGRRRGPASHTSGAICCEDGDCLQVRMGKLQSVYAPRAPHPQAPATGSRASPARTPLAPFRLGAKENPLGRWSPSTTLELRTSITMSLPPAHPLHEAPGVRGSITFRGLHLHGCDFSAPRPAWSSSPVEVQVLRAALPLSPDSRPVQGSSNGVGYHTRPGTIVREIEHWAGCSAAAPQCGSGCPPRWDCSRESGWAGRRKRCDARWLFRWSAAPARSSRVRAPRSACRRCHPARKGEVHS